MRFRRLGFAAVAAAVLSVTIGPGHADALDSNSYPNVRSGNFANVPMHFPTTPYGGQVNIQIELGPWGSLPGYYPCSNPADPYVSVCSVGGYYKTHDFYANGTSQIPHGYFIDNQNNGLVHNWGNKVQSANIETYVWNDTTPGYFNDDVDGDACQVNPQARGGVRARVTGFPHAAWGGYYSTHLGQLPFPTCSDTYFNGFVTRGGVPVQQQGTNAFEFKIAFFQESNFKLTSTGYPVAAFGEKGHKWDSFYTTGPIAPGRYHIFLTDEINLIKYETYVDVGSTPTRIDFDLNQYCFGFTPPWGSSCTQIPY